MEEAAACLRAGTVVGSIAVMIYGLYETFQLLKEKKQGFGPNTLKAIGVILFLPTLLILAVVTEFKTETLAALLGTVAGYVLSSSKADEKTCSASAKQAEAKQNAPGN